MSRPTSDAERRLKKASFLAAYADTGNITTSAQIAGIARPTHYDWMQDDPEYVTAFLQAEGQAIDSLEREARRRAIEGTEEPVYQGGREVGTIRKFSDVLLIFLLKGARPQKYRDNSRVEVTGANGGPVHSVVTSGLEDHEKTALRDAIRAELERREVTP